MKRNIWGIAAFAAALTAAVPGLAFAAAGNHTVDSMDTPSAVIDVQAKYEGSTDTQVVYKVDVEWGAMEFTYHESAENKWNPQTHQYELSVTGSWSESGNEVTVKNHSNAGVNAALSFQAADGQSVTGEFYQGDDRLNEGLVLESAVGTPADAPPSGTVQLKLSGSLDSAMTDFSKIGTITVTVN
ncbi:MAG: hypothetical protein Q4E24_07945 [bacterium]|nr:hypothetical protein [bacterium]